MCEREREKECVCVCLRESADCVGDDGGGHYLVRPGAVCSYCEWDECVDGTSVSRGTRVCMWYECVFLGGSGKCVLWW